MKESYKFNGTLIKPPKDFSFEWYRISQSSRVLTGAMKMDIIAKKRKYLFVYDVISGTALKQIADIIDHENNAFFDFEWTENNEVKTGRFYAGAIKGKKLRTGNEWYWINVTFDIIEE